MHLRLSFGHRLLVLASLFAVAGAALVHCSSSSNSGSTSTSSSYVCCEQPGILDTPASCTCTQIAPNDKVSCSPQVASCGAPTYGCCISYLTDNSDRHCDCAAADAGCPQPEPHATSVQSATSCP